MFPLSLTGTSIHTNWFQVGKYQVGKTIGEGTFGKVKLAVNTETGEKMAIKVRTGVVWLLWLYLQFVSAIGSERLCPHNFNPKDDEERIEGKKETGNIA